MNSDLRLNYSQLFKNNDKHSKSLNELFGIFSLKKSPILKESQTNEYLEYYINTSLENDDKGFGKVIEMPKSLEDLKNTAVDYIVKYCNALGISLPPELKDNIHITLYEGSEDCPRGMTLGNNIKINDSAFNKLSKNRQLGYMVHEILHIVATKQNKMYYDYTYNKENALVQPTKIIYGKHTGYHNKFVGGHKNTDVGEFLNEGFTEMISFVILHKNGIDTSDSKGSFYLHYIYIIDYLLIELSKRTKINYQELLSQLIKGNILGNAQYLTIIADVLGTDCFSDLLDLGFNGLEKSRKKIPILEQQIMGFISKHKQIYFSPHLSQDMKKLIGNITYTYQLV